MGAEGIRTVAVIGAGVMGAGIAAHLANAGCSVILLDMVKDGPDPAAIARQAITAQAKGGGLMHPGLTANIRPGTIEHDLEMVRDADWVIEAIVERVDAKRGLYAALLPFLQPHAVLSSNTSTIPLAVLREGLPSEAAERLLITHFFNPPRHMRLLELVAEPGTAPDAVERIAAVGDRGLGKTVVACKDTPGFLANRIGCFWMAAAHRFAVEMGLSVEEADAAIGRPFGIPATGIFGLTDLVGIDLMPKVWRSLADALPAADPFHAMTVPLPAVSALIERAFIGRKAKAGFYRKGEAGMDVFDLTELSYRPLGKPRLESLASPSPRALMEHPDRGGRYAFAVMASTLSYAAALVPEISDGVAPIDEAMRLGYNWRRGPFELIDQIGADWLAERLTAAGQAVPPLLATAAGKGGFYRDRAVLDPAGSRVTLTRPAGHVLIEDFRRVCKPVEGNAAADLWDMGDGIACLEFHRKMNAMAPESMAAVAAAIRRVTHDFRALVIGNDAANFCAGADLGLFLAALEKGDIPFIEDFVRQGQSTYDSLRRAPFPVVGAVTGLALGGGCEILLHCDAVQAHAESAIGLVERKVGLIPAWGGCRRMLARAAADPTLPKGPMPGVIAAFDPIVLASVSGSALLARDLGLLLPEDGITMHRDRLLADAKARALTLLAEGYSPPESVQLRLPGPSGRHTLMNRAEGLVPLGKLHGHDLVVAEILAEVLTGGSDADPTRPVPEETILELELRGFVELAKVMPTRDRIAHMLNTGKPLKN